MKRLLSNTCASFFVLLLFMPGLAYGQSDLFEIRTPNAMIIFDTSSSMNMDVNGLSVSSGNAEGTDKVIRNYEGGGNHPNSKLYQAKHALREVIQDIENVNLGFSTYAQTKTTRSRGYYWRERRDYTSPSSDQWYWYKRYWRFTKNRHSYTKTEFSSNSFTDNWGTAHGGVTIGYTFYRSHTFDRSWDNNNSAVPPFNPPGSSPGTYTDNLKYTVTNIVYNAEYNWYTYYYESDSHDHYDETWRYLYLSDSNPIDCDASFTPTWGSWKTFVTTDPDQIANPGKWACTGPVQVTGTPGGFSPWYTQYDWISFDGATSCPSTQGTDNFPANATQTTKWTLVDPNSLATTHPVRITQTNCYDNSSFTYPSDGTTNKPHTWSYFKIDGSGNWPSGIQPDPYYPATAGTPGSYDNRFFFTNFPEVDDSMQGYAVRKTIVDWLNLNPVQSPETGRWHTKLPLKGGWNTLPGEKMGVTSNTSDNPTRQTPLADSLLAAKKYFNDYINKYKGGDAPSKSNCRGNYVVLLTDGLESCRFLNPPTNTLVDYGAAVTASAELFSIGVQTFVIGFGKDVKGNETLNNIAVSGGTGRAYFAENMDQLKNAFKTIFQAIGGFYSRSNPVVTMDRDRIYRAFFTLPGWEGHLAAFGIDDQGVVGNELWDAGEVMASPTGARGEVTTLDKDNNSVVFNTSDTNAAALNDLLNASSEDVNEDGKMNLGDSKTIVGFTLNANHDDCPTWDSTALPSCHGPGYYKGKRSPKWKLGDIYHSTPLVVGKPPFSFPDALFPKKYSDFKSAQNNRPTLLYVGANDGMLHAFNDSDGTERFAIIPKSLLGKLKEVRKEHHFFVDSSPRMFDVFVKTMNEWRTFIVSGLREGGNTYFAIDATDPTKKPAILWEATDAGMGNTWSRPVMGIVRIGGQYRFVAFVGGGYSPAPNVGNAFYVIDVEEGTILKKFNVGDASNKVPAGATAFDRDQDGLVDAVYFGDYQGALWKIRIEKEEDLQQWQLVKLFEPAEKNPVFYPPAVTKNNQGKVLVYFGQGNELNIFEKDKYYYFFEIWDNDGTGVKNWEIKFDNPGEKVLAAPAVANNVVYFTTWEYTGIEADCGAGKGRLYGLTTTRQGVAGGAAALFLDPVAGTELGTPKKYFDLGKGIPSAPIVTNGMVYVSRSIGKTEGEIKPEGKRIRKWSRGSLKYWREILD